MQYRVLLFYKYVTITDPDQYARKIRSLMEKLTLKGRVIIAEEGINGTLEGTYDATEQFIHELKTDNRFADIVFKESEGTGSVFPKLSVKVRKEIVGTHLPPEEADPRKHTSPHLSPEELRAWYKTKKDFAIIDMRNDYEYISGHFAGSINPKLNNSRDLPQAVARLEELKHKTVVTVCTGGVRCEKMSAYLLSQGFMDVYQLDGGMHTYMEKYPGKDFLGTLYTFDGRITMHFGGKREVIGTCHLCGEKTEQYTNCGNDMCHLHFLVCEHCAEGKTHVYCSDTCMHVSLTQ